MSEVKVNSKYEILTPTGFRDFHGIREIMKDVYYTIELSNGKTIKCSNNHPFMLDNIKIQSNELTVGTKIDSVNGEIYVDSIEKTNSEIQLYDIVEVDNGNIFNVDGIVSHNCDFITSGQTVIDGVILEEYKNKHIEEPMEKRGFDSNLWIWRPPNYSKDYVISADVARGDGTDFSAFHVIDVQNLEQVAEYKGKISTKDFGNLCMNTAVEYNNALLVIENASIGWAAIQQVIDRDYDNLFYTSKDLHYVDVQRQISNKYRNAEQKMVPGFSMTMKTRPLVIAKLEEYFREKTVIVHSSRLIEELFVFIYHNMKAQAMEGYNDDLPISLAIGMWVRDTALRLKSEGIALQKDVLNRTLDYEAVYQPTENQNDYWEMETGREKESLDWLIN
ncbi:hypothetical protein H8D04_00170 [bacterium]|nr:hypothetical protein [bacterium]